MEHREEHPSRRRLLRGAALTAAAGVLLPGAGAASAADTDHPLARWSGDSPTNFTASNRPSAHPVRRLIVHITQTTFTGTLGIFQNPLKNVSAHYVIRSSDGYIAQCMRERDIAWHAGNWEFNADSIGIEHEGWVDRPRYFTDTLYEQSAALTAALCGTYDIPKTREHIIGHHEVPGATHTDPGPLWDWVRYIRLVNLS
ncbi:N-acetylmuramoyl-L-alanine amidase [Streptomyces sp. A3M-1-3]|uniref:N-acetylmuramoyl-L-alanine amidase n=1 Tax=Streptomyces sp. A3M-1-3 TaxID=2962044 RepID=UPI0020B7E0B1|nr:peptidoglycan recognition family protein [Streptomyces sp. A3M-1-3]MCP3818803.1 N-acetylmuramoyl-L-alanine amidase [Streptomyces sp. A3M-1-3]